jgi:hypothetical protein
MSEQKLYAASGILNYLIYYAQPSFLDYKAEISL